MEQLARNIKLKTISHRYQCIKAILLNELEDSVYICYSRAVAIHTKQYLCFRKCKVPWSRALDVQRPEYLWHWSS